MYEEDKAVCCCFTGHRPEKLGMSENQIKQKLYHAIDLAIKNGFTKFFSGMARGVDIWAAQIVLERRESNKDIQLVCAVPFAGFEKRRSPSEKRIYLDILSSADCVKTMSMYKFYECFQIRNRYMVDHSSLVIAAYNGSAGGTQNTICYAKEKNVKIINIFDLN